MLWEDFHKEFIHKNDNVQTQTENLHKQMKVKEIYAYVCRLRNIISNEFQMV